MEAEEYSYRNSQDKMEYSAFISFFLRGKKKKEKMREYLNLISVKGMHDLRLCRLQCEDKFFWPLVLAGI